jgi:hypothetical protein
MVEMVMMLFGLWFVIVFASICVWILDMGSECENWQKNVTVDDLRELDRVLKN